MNAGDFGLGKRQMVLDLNPAIDDTLNYLVLVVEGMVSTLRFGSPWRVLRA